MVNLHSFLLVVCIMLITILSNCKEEDERVIEFSEPLITLITNNILANRGTTIEIRFKADAEAGIKSITLDNSEVDFNPELSSQTIVVEYSLESNEELGEKSLKIELIDNQNKKTETSLTLDVVPAGTPSLSLSSETLQITKVERSSELTISVNVNSKEPIDSMVISDKNGSRLTSFTDMPLVESFNYEWNYNIPIDIGLNDDSLHLIHKIYDAAGQSSSPVEFKAMIEKGESEIYTFTKSDINTNVIAHAFDFYGNKLSLFGSFDADNLPESIESLTINLIDSDTIIHVNMDDEGRIDKIFGTTKGGEFHNFLIQYEYPNDTVIIQSVYDFNFSNNNYQLIEAVNVDISSDEFDIITEPINGRTTVINGFDQVLPLFVSRLQIIAKVGAIVGVGIGVTSVFGPGAGIAATVLLASNLMNDASANDNIIATNQPPPDQTENYLENIDESVEIDGCQDYVYTFNHFYYTCSNGSQYGPECIYDYSGNGVLTALQVEPTIIGSIIGRGSIDCPRTGRLSLSGEAYINNGSCTSSKSIPSFYFDFTMSGNSVDFNSSDPNWEVTQFIFDYSGFYFAGIYNIPHIPDNGIDCDGDSINDYYFGFAYGAFFARVN